MAKAKTIFEREFEITKVEQKDTEKLKGEDSHTETAVLIAENVGKMTMVFNKLPFGLASGKKITVLIQDSQSKLSDHAEKKPVPKKPSKENDKK